MKLHVVIAPDAELQIEELSDWWEAHRPDAASFADALEAVFSKLCELPHLGRIHKHQVRFFQVPGTPYAVYYEIDESRAELQVIAVWSLMRGQGPLR